MKPSSRIAQRIFFHLCEKITIGSLTVTTSDGHRHTFGPKDSPLAADLHVRNDDLYGELLSQGEWGLGWGYVYKKWESADVRKLCLVLMLNEEVFRPYVKLAMAASPVMRRILSVYEDNTSTDEDMRRRMISRTYDVGNEFYEWMLGPTMAYTCAIWPRPDATLEEAQENKFRIITQKARVEPHHSVLDMGCGWGNLCNYIHEQTGARTKGITLSREQIRWAQAHYPHLDFEFCNYAHVQGTYDRIVSVGMGEHVGRQNFDGFLQLVSDRLRPGGRFVCHMMSCYDGLLMHSKDRRWASFASVLMPNCDVSSMDLVARGALKTGDLRVIHTETYGIQYVRTAEEWLKNCRRHRDEIVRRYSEEFFRIYEYSWQMGAAAFEAGMTVLHVVFEKQPYGSDTRDSLVSHAGG